MEEGRITGNELKGKKIVSKTGKYFGTVQDLLFDPKSGEIVYLVVGEASKYAKSLELERDENGDILIPFYSVISIGDFVIISEEDLI